jgi:hypothetical protein
MRNIIGEVNVDSVLNKQCVVVYGNGMLQYIEIKKECSLIRNE